MPRRTVWPAPPEIGVAREQAAAFEELLPRVRPRLKAILGRYRIPAEDADDLVQEALLCTLRRWQEIKAPEGWLLGVFDRMCRSYWSKRRRSRVECVENLELERLAGVVPAPQIARECAVDVTRLLASLPPRAAAVLWLRYGEGMVSVEVAAALGYRSGSVRTVSSRAIGRLLKMRSEAVANAPCTSTTQVSGRV